MQTLFVFFLLVACISKPGVAFTVQMNTHKPTLGSKQLIGFDKITTNIGHAFNNNTSVFTAPVGGMYVFEVVVGTDGHATTDLEIVKNGVYLKRVYGYSYNHWGTSTASVTTHLVSGDQVYVKNNVNNHGLVGHQLTSFSGYLVKPDCNFSWSLWHTFCTSSFLNRNRIKMSKINTF